MKPENYYDAPYCIFNKWFSMAGLLSKIAIDAYDVDDELRFLYRYRPTNIRDEPHYYTKNYRTVSFEWSLLSEENFAKIKELALKDLEEKINKLVLEKQKIISL